MKDAIKNMIKGLKSENTKLSKKRKEGDGLSKYFDLHAKITIEVNEKHIEKLQKMV